MRIDDRGFTPLEAAVLAKLLDGDHPVLEALRRQLESASAHDREMTGVGFYLDINTTAAAAPVHAPQFRIGDVAADLESVPSGAAFNVLIENGYLRVLEGVTVDGPWPDEPGSFHLKYFDGGPRSRTWATLERAQDPGSDALVAE